MSLIYPEGQNFDCGSCTKCCRGWHVHVDAHAFQAVTASPLFTRLTEQNGHPPVYLEDETEGPSSARTQMQNGRCVFLEDDKYCSIHKEIGPTAKPLGCSLFPFILVPTPDGVYAGLSFTCSAVQHNSGRPVTVHEAELRRIVAASPHRPVTQEVALESGVSIPWTLYTHVEARLADRLSSGGDLPRAMWDGMMSILLFAAQLRRGETTVSVEGFERTAAVAVPRDELFARLEQMLTVGLLGAIESREPSVCKENTAAVNFGGVLHSESFARDINLRDFKDYRARIGTDGTPEQFHRFVSHLLFRKFLVQRDDVCSRAVGWHLTLPLLEWYRDLSAFVSGRLAPELADVFKAFDVVERSFSAHGQYIRPFFVELARGYAQMLDMMPELTAGLQ